MAKLLLGNRDVDRRRHKFRDTHHRHLRERCAIFRWDTYTNASKDLRRDVLQRYLPLNEGARWNGYTSRLSRCVWISPWYCDPYPRCRMLPHNTVGTSLICAFLEIFMSMVPPRVLQRIFPPMVTGTVILMIGASLVGSSGIPNWGGGSNDCRSRPETGFFQLCPDIAAPKPKLCVRFHDQSGNLLMILQMGVTRIHRSRICLLHLDHLDRNFWISVPKEYQHHRRSGCGMYCRGRHGLH